jgi:hypothetical protein
MMKIDYTDRSLVAKFDAILERGLCVGVGKRDGQMCIEAAICAVLDLPHGDNPSCVEPAVRSFKIRLNDARWSSPVARAAGLRDLGLAQIGSRGVVQGQEFAKRVAEQTIRILIPKLFRSLFPLNSRCLAAADRCEREGTMAASRNAEAACADAADAAAACTEAAYADAAACAAYAEAASAEAAYAVAAAACAAYAVAAAAEAADAVAACTEAAYAEAADNSNPDKYLLLSASLALQILRDLNSPGCAFLDGAA